MLCVFTNSCRSQTAEGWAKKLGVVTMGCGVECPYVPCRHREDWGHADPSGGAVDDYRKTRDL